MPYQLKPGFVWNPLKKFPRNSLCPCKSGKKFKKCHLKSMPEALPLNALLKDLKKNVAK
jgi:hypothetical protein